MNDQALEEFNGYKEEFARLTSELKEMSSNDPSYQRVWDERAEIKGKIDMMEKYL